MKLAASWLVRAGAALVILSFFLPSAAAPAAGPQAASVESLFKVASHEQQPVLYLTLAGAVAAIVLGLIAERRPASMAFLSLGQGVALALGELSVLAVTLPLSVGFRSVQFEIGTGSLTWLLGYLAASSGILMASRSGRRKANSEPSLVGPAISRSAPPESRPRLEVLGGDVTSPVVIESDDFRVGRSRRNQLVLDEIIVSGLHARFRHAEGAWFIQDQGSFNGTYVNDKKIRAQRLKNGDRIGIGKTVLVFRL